MSKSISKQQEAVTQKRFEMEQQKLAISNFQADHGYKVEQFKNKIAELREILERQERESQKIAARISQKKDELENRSTRRTTLAQEIEQT